MRCDSHVHIVGPLDRYPQVPERTYIARVAAVDTLKRLGSTRGIDRFVIVQPSFYGTDNSATLDALDALEGNGRGVAVIDARTVSETELADFARRGVRGLRLNIYSPVKVAGAESLDAGFARLAGIAKARGWHVQVIAPLPQLLENAELLARSPVPVVVDHYGLYGAARPDSAEGRRLIDLLRSPQVWMKLSAPYRMAHGPLNVRPDRSWLAALLAAAPDRCVWGSDWPHPPAHEQQKGAALDAPYRDLPYETLVDEFVAALPAAELAERVLGDNPARLYGF